MRPPVVASFHPSSNTFSVTDCRPITHTKVIHPTYLSIIQGSKSPRKHADYIGTLNSFSQHHKERLLHIWYEAYTG